MNSRAILYFLNLEIDLIKVTYAYKRPVWKHNGMPRSIVNGGKLRVEFQTDQRIIRFFEEMTSDYFATYGKTATMPEAKVVIYDANGYIIRTHKHLDVIIQRVKNIFISEGETPMMSYVVFTIGVQNYGTKHTEKWNISDTEPSPYKTQIVAIESEKEYFVDKIEMQDLHEGSTNSGDNDKMGMIHGKEYTLKVLRFKNNEVPKNKNTIKWSYGYSKDNEIVIGNIKQTGEEITFKTDDLDFCGQKITFYAYIDKKENETELEVFHHNRFRWFDRKKVETQINIRKTKPWKVNQGSTSLCGMACIFYLFAKEDSSGYEKFAKTLHRTGKAIHNGYTLEPNESTKEEMYNTNPNTSKEHPWMPEIDWITLATTRNKESDFGYTGKVGQDASAINWPWLMSMLGKKLLGYKTAEMDYYKVNKSYLRDFFGSDEKVRILEKDIHKDFENGYKICMMIDGSMVDEKPGANYSLSDFGEYHWVVYEGGLEILNGEKPETDYDKVTHINFNVATWGELRDSNVRDGRISKKITLTKKQFIANYYGYLKFK